jgi:hypothetical protein
MDENHERVARKDEDWEKERRVPAYLVIHELFRAIILLQQRNQLDDIRVIGVELVSSTVKAQNDGSSSIRLGRWDDGRAWTWLETAILHGQFGF